MEYEKLKLARTRILSDYPFFGYIMMHIPVKVLDEIDGSEYGEATPTEVHLTEKLVTQHSVNDIIFVYLHELGHIILDHFGRKGDREMKRWNIACDLAINSQLVYKMHVPEPSIPLLIDPQCQDMTAEEIYEKVKVKYVHVLDAHRYGDVPKEFKRKLARVIREAIEIHKRMIGSEPGEFGQLLDAALTDKYLPFELLFNVIAQRYIVDYTWLCRDRRFTSVYLPDVERKHVEIVAAVDTSGSITDDEGREFLGVLRNLYHQFPSLHITLLCCDTRVHSVYEVDSAFDLESIVFNRGGTDFRPVFKWIEENKPDCKLLVYLTDGNGVYPNEPPSYPVVWATVDQEPPWGEVVRLR